MLSINNDLRWSSEAGEVGPSVELRQNRFRIRRRRQWLKALDWTVALTLLAPLCIFYWRGLWQLLDIYLKLEDNFGVRHPGGFISLLAGYFLAFVCNACQYSVTRFITDERNSLTVRLVVSRIYTVVFAFGLVNLWRGVWQLLDAYFTNSWQSGAASAVIGSYALASLRALRNIAAPPIVINTDLMDGEYTNSPTMFKTIVAKKGWFVFVDVLFSVVVVGSLVVFVWRGLWTVMDRQLFESNKVLSCWMSLSIGYLVVFVAYVLQKTVASTSANLFSNFSRVIFEDSFYLFASFGAISVWRGIWLFADVYIYPEDYELSNWVTTIIGLFGSLLLFSGNTLLAKGVFLDGANKDGSGCMFSNQYLRKILQIKEDDIEMVIKVNTTGAQPSVNSQVARLMDEDGRQNNCSGTLVKVEVVIERETVL